MGIHSRLDLELILNDLAEYVDRLVGHEIQPLHDNLIKVYLKVNTTTVKYKNDDLVEESQWSIITKAEPFEDATYGTFMLVALFCKN